MSLAPVSGRRVPSLKPVPGGRRHFRDRLSDNSEPSASSSLRQGQMGR
jgi:hypothetical protein